MNVIIEPDWDALDEETLYYTMMQEDLERDKGGERDDRNQKN